MKLEMCIKSSFNTAIERQIGEAVSIDFEGRKGKILMNSKSQHNCCSLPMTNIGVGFWSPGEEEDEIEK